jgi:hypothetical protein
VPVPEKRKLGRWVSRQFASEVFPEIADTKKLENIPAFLILDRNLIPV